MTMLMWVSSKLKIEAVPNSQGPSTDYGESHLNKSIYMNKYGRLTMVHGALGKVFPFNKIGGLRRRAHACLASFEQDVVA